MAEHAALRPAGRAGGVDDLGQVGGAAGPTPFFDLLRPHLRAAGREVGQPTEAAAVDLPHVGQRGQASPRGGDLPGVIVGLGHHGNRAGVAEDPLHLLQRGGRVDRHGDTAGGQDGVVNKCPFEPGARHQRHPATRLDAGRDEASGEAANLPGELAPGHRRPGALHLALETGRVGPVLRIRENIIRDIVIGLHDIYHGHREFLHRCSLMSGGLSQPPFRLRCDGAHRPGQKVHNPGPTGPRRWGLSALKGPGGSA